MFRLRYYQNDARDGISRAFENHRSTCVIMPTATGKTEVYLSVAVEQPRRVLVLAHRDYLITSPIKRLAAAGYRDVAIEKAKLSSEAGGGKAQIVFASIQSISQPHRLQRFDPLDFSLVVVDEGHRAVASSYRTVLEYFQARNPDLKVLIPTATPKRKDGIALSNVCESVAYEMTPATAAAEGWIAPPRFYVREVPTLDFSKVKMKGADLDPDQIADMLNDEEPLHKICASLAEDQGPTIVFCPRVDVAQAYAAVMSRRYRIDKAVAIHQGSSDEEMERATKGLADGTVDYVFNVDKLTEGFDVPRVVRVAWAAPTASLVRWTQGCGRGFRPDGSVAKLLVGNRDDSARRRLLIEQSAKPFCSIVSYYPSNCQHQICEADDLLGGSDLPPAVKEAAKHVQAETSRKPGGSNTAEDMETARLVVDLRSALDEARRDVKAKAQVADEEYDGLGGQSLKYKDAAPSGDVSETPMAVAASWGSGELATDRQQNWLKWKGVPAEDAAGYTKWRASVVRDLFEMGVPLATAAGYGKRQALKVRDEIKTKRGAKSA